MSLLFQLYYSLVFFFLFIYCAARMHPLWCLVLSCLFFFLSFSPAVTQAIELNSVIAVSTLLFTCIFFPFHLLCSKNASTLVSCLVLPFFLSFFLPCCDTSNRIEQCHCCFNSIIHLYFFFLFIYCEAGMRPLWCLGFFFFFTPSRSTKIGGLFGSSNHVALSV